MGNSVREVGVGVVAGLVLELFSYWIRSFWSKDKKTECKKRSRRQIRLVRAIIHELPERRAIKNEHLKAWMSDLHRAAHAGDKLLSSAADAAALEKALTKLEGLTKDANTYLGLLEYGNKKEALHVLNSFAAACRVNHELALPDHYKKFIELYVARNSASAAPAAASNPDPEMLIEQYPSKPLVTSKLKMKKPLSIHGVAGNLDTSPSIDCFRINHICNGYEDHDHLNKKRKFPDYSFDFRRPEKQRVLGDSLGEELENNSSWLDDTERPALTYDGEPSINDRMKMKGKCQALSCSPSSSYGGANDHFSPSFPEENDE